MARVLYLFAFFIAVLLSHGCAGSGGATLKIDLQHLVGRQNMPEELTCMLRDPGYDWVPIRDPHNQHGVKTVLQDDEYRMRFEYLQTRQVRIEVLHARGMQVCAVPVTQLTGYSKL